MSPILDLQKRARELGRIRIGDRVVTKSGKEAPNKLDKPRLTSPSRELLEQAARIYGGEVKSWKSPAGAEFELYVTAEALEVILPPGEMGLSQWFEMWSGGGCQRRCDGETEMMSDGPCLCDRDDIEMMRALAQNGEACKPTTRLKVMLPRVGDLGLWRLETHGYHAAAELAGTLDILRAGGLGQAMVRARLRIEQRTAKRPGVGTLRYIVPVLELLGLDVEALANGQANGAIGAPHTPELPAGQPQALPQEAARTLPAAETPRPEDPQRGAPPRAAAVSGLLDTPPAGIPPRKRARKPKETEPKPQPEPSSEPRANADGEELLTRQQMRKIMVLAEEIHWTDEQVRKAAGVTSRRDITKVAANRLIDTMEAVKDGDPERTSASQPSVEEAGSAPASAEEQDEGWVAAFTEFAELLESPNSFSGPIARSRYRDTLMTRLGVQSLEELTIDQFRKEAELLRKRLSA